jgi:hypothetical protein
MRRALQVLAVSVSAAALVVSGTTVASAKGMAPIAYTCTGGDFASGNLTHIPSGNYASITVRGACDVPADAVISVGNVYVAAGAVLDAQSAPSTITVGHNVIAAPGSLLGLGCQPPSYTGNTAHQCTVEPDGHSTITVNGNVTAFWADTVLLNGITVNGNVTLIGGGGDIPWAIKNNTISANLTVVGVTADWLGVLFNQVGGNATLIHITATDPGDPGRLVFVVRNSIGQNLICAGLAPGVSGGFIPGEVNVVGGHAIGQCASLI